MRLKPMVAAVLLSTALGAASGSRAGAPATASPANPAKPTVSFSWKTVGSRILVGADPNVVRLPDGRIRLYWAAGDVGLASAVSSDGVKFAREPGRRLDPAIGGPHTRVIASPDGGWRLFFNDGSGEGIGSAVSTDGLDFTVEEGLRVTAVAARLAPKELSPGDIVVLAGGRYRMYFSSFLTTHRDPRTVHERIRSATSSDLLNWRVESGDRIGGATGVTGSGEHPAAIRLANGSTALFYGRPSPFNLVVSVAKDGVNFKAEQALMGLVLDSAIIRRGTGFLLYYGTYEAKTKTSYINVARLAFHNEPPAPTCVVPDLPGKSLAQAKRLLATANCKLGTIRYAYSSNLAEGWVIAQNRLGRTLLPGGSTVALVVSRGRR